MTTSRWVCAGFGPCRRGQGTELRCSDALPCSRAAAVFFLVLHHPRVPSPQPPGAAEGLQEPEADSGLGPEN